MVDVEGWGFDRYVACSIVGISEAQLANWISRYGLFPEKRRGTGYSNEYAIRDLMTLNAMAVLIDAGFEPSEAADALRPYGSPYGSMLHNGRDEFASTPGEIFISRNSNGDWVQIDGTDRALVIRIRSWVLFDQIMPQVKQAILSNPRGYSVEEARRGIETYENQIQSLRKQRFEFNRASKASPSA